MTTRGTDTHTQLYMREENSNKMPNYTDTAVGEVLPRNICLVATQPFELVPKMKENIDQPGPALDSRNVFHVIESDLLKKY